VRVAIVRYNGGNTVSVTNALSRLGAEVVITDSPEKLAGADKVIFPGVGEASTAMESLRASRVDRVIPELRQPVLGICLGMQLMCERSEENDTKCLAIIAQSVRRFAGEGLKVPHVGWNTITATTSPLFNGVEDGEYMYFVHSYFVELGGSTVGTSEYAGEFSSAVASQNFYGVQFHPERSGSAGARVLQNFLSL